MISLAVAEERSVLAEWTRLTLDNHTVELAPSVASLLGQVGASVSGLKAVAVAVGPGSFTGVRIGLGFAKGLALAGAPAPPLVGVSTLDIAVRGLPTSERRAIAVVPVGRGRVVWQRYAAEEQDWRPEGDSVTGDWKELAAEAAAGIRLVGEIDSAGYEILLTSSANIRVATPSQNVRRAAHLAEIGFERLERGQADDAAALAPIYARQPASGSA